MNKKIKIPLATLTLLVANFIVGYLSLPSEFGSKSLSAQQVELTEIVKSPQSWQGQKIRVMGYFDFEFEGGEIYLSQKDLNGKTYANSAALVLDSIGVYNRTDSFFKEALRARQLLALRKMDGHPVTVEGVFKTGGLSSGFVFVDYFEAL